MIELRETAPGAPPFPVSDDLLVVSGYEMALMGQDVIRTPAIDPTGVSLHLTLRDAEGRDITLMFALEAAAFLADSIRAQITEYIRWAEENPTG